MKEYWEFFKEEILITFLVVTLVVTFFVAFSVYITYLFEKNITCPRYYKSVNLEGKYDFWAGGCFVNYKGQWIPRSNLHGGKIN